MVRHIRAYLDSQYIQSKVGSPELFQTKAGEPVSGKAVNNLMNAYANNLRARFPGTYENMPASTITSTVIQKARARWAALDEDARQSYERRANKNSNGFMKYLEDELNK